MSFQITSIKNLRISNGKIRFTPTIEVHNQTTFGLKLSRLNFATSVQAPDGTWEFLGNTTPESLANTKFKANDVSIIEPRIEVSAPAVIFNAFSNILSKKEIALRILIDAGIGPIKFQRTIYRTIDPVSLTLLPR